MLVQIPPKPLSIVALVGADRVNQPKPAISSTDRRGLPILLFFCGGSSCARPPAHTSIGSPSTVKCSSGSVASGRPCATTSTSSRAGLARDQTSPRTS